MCALNEVKGMRLKMFIESIKSEYKEEGLAEGLAEGIEQEKISVVRSMLENDIDYKMISKVSGKSIEEIKQISLSI